MTSPSSPYPLPETVSIRNLRSTTSREAVLSPQQIFSEIANQIPLIKQYTEITYENISPEDGNLICQSLTVEPRVERSGARINFNAATGVITIKVMPGPLQDVHQHWINQEVCSWAMQGLISPDEIKLLHCAAGTDFGGFTGPYQGSVKQPDYFIRADFLPFPSVVFEAGWSESWPRLRNDKDLWMLGTPSVEVTILLKWTKNSGNRIKGSLEVWRRNGASLTVEVKEIFPRPVPLPQNDSIQFTKGQLYGPALIAGQPPGAVLTLEMSRLRELAEEVIRLQMGMVPA